MQYSGTIQRVLTTKNTVTLILDTEIGPRGIELERPEWVHLLSRAGETDPQALIGWAVEYDPEHDSLNLIDPDELLTTRPTTARGPAGPTTRTRLTAAQAKRRASVGWLCSAPRESSLQ